MDEGADYPSEMPLIEGQVKRRVLVVANPVAGGFRYRALDAFASRIDAAGLLLDVQLTRKAGDLTAIAANLDPGIDTLVVGGGDGSLNEAAVGLSRRVAAPPALGILPFGTANVLARELALPFAPKAIADAVIARRVARLHLGRIGDRPFLLMVSAGFDADVVHAVDSRTKRRWGRLAYVFAALRLAVAGRGRDVIVEADGRTTVCRLAVVTTARFYGGPHVITRHTMATEPGLRLVTLANDRPWTLAKAAVMLGLGRLDRLAEATDRPVSEVRLRGAAINLQIDGDQMAATDALITTDPLPLPVIVRR